MGFFHNGFDLKPVCVLLVYLRSMSTISLKISVAIDRADFLPGYYSTNLLLTLLLIFIHLEHFCICSLVCAKVAILKDYYNK